MSRPCGSRLWVFPDGELPPSQPADPTMVNEQTHGHESVVVVNTGKADATLSFTIYFSDREPVHISPLRVPGERVICFRTDEPLGPEGTRVPAGCQYSLLIESDEPVVAQIGRMDIRQSNLAYYTVMGYAAG